MQVAVMMAVSVVSGYLVSKMQKPPKMQSATSRLGELSSQTSKEGEPQPTVYGIARPIGGNVIYQSGPIKRIVKKLVGYSSSGGKGGGGGGRSTPQYQDEEHVYRYYAVRVCRGDNISFKRIWKNGKLVYSTVQSDQVNNDAFLTNKALYNGSYTQNPDPSLEAMLGVGNVPAYRGLAYMVVANEDLTELAGNIPQYVFEVIRPENKTTVTSNLFPYLTEEGLNNFTYNASIHMEQKGYFREISEGLNNFTYSCDLRVKEKFPDDIIGNFTYSCEIDVTDTTKGVETQEGLGSFSYNCAIFKGLKKVQYDYQEGLGSFSYNCDLNSGTEKRVDFKWSEKIGNFNYNCEINVKETGDDN